MTNQQQALEKKHGLPEEFEQALLDAVNKEVITLDEMITGAVKYRDEWAIAGKAGDFTKVKLHRAGLSKDQISIALALIPKKGDVMNTAVDRAKNVMELRVGTDLSEDAEFNILKDIILKFMGIQ